MHVNLTYMINPTIVSQQQFQSPVDIQRGCSSWLRISPDSLLEHLAAPLKLFIQYYQVSHSPQSIDAQLSELVDRIMNTPFGNIIYCPVFRYAPRQYIPIMHLQIYYMHLGGDIYIIAHYSSASLLAPSTNPITVIESHPFAISLRITDIAIAKFHSYNIPEQNHDLYQHTKRLALEDLYTLTSRYPPLSRLYTEDCYLSLALHFGAEALLSTRIIDSDNALALMMDVIVPRETAHFRFQDTTTEPLLLTTPKYIYRPRPNTQWHSRHPTSKNNTPTIWELLNHLGIPYPRAQEERAWSDELELQLLMEMSVFR